MNREILDRPFAPAEIKQRTNDRGERVDYLEGATVIQRLNDAFAADWSFEIVEHTIRDNEMVVLGRMTAGGVTKTQFGAMPRSGSAGDDLKAATTDAIKKCATLFGIGLQLYFETTVATPAAPVAVVARPVPAATPVPLPTRVVPYRAAEIERDTRAADDQSGGGDPAGRLSNRQLLCIFGVAKDKGWTSKDVREFVKDKYGKVIDYLTKREASTLIDTLKAGSR